MEVQIMSSQRCPNCGKYNVGNDWDKCKFCGIYNPSKNIIECPYCHSIDTKKIGTGSRMLSVGLFGFGSGKVGKQWHCNKCNSDF